MPKKPPRLFKYKFFTVVLLAGLFILIFISIQKKPVRMNLLPNANDETRLVESSKSSLVRGFPDFPGYYDAQIITSKKEVLGDQVTYTAEYELKSGSEGVLNWYIDSLAEDGFVLGEVSEGGGKLYAYLNKVTYAFEVNRSQSASVLTITATYDED